MNAYQQTLAKPVSCKGIGVHSGMEVSVTILPAPINHGITFGRVDLPGTVAVPALFNKVVDTSLATVVGQDGFIVSTIEHLMAALTGMQIDNAKIEISGHEIPIMDGSALPFVHAFKEAGLVFQESPRYYLKVTDPIELSKNGKKVGIYPLDGFQISCEIEFAHPVIGKQEKIFTLENDSFETEIAGARTFGFYEDAKQLQMLGLGGGGELTNCVIIKGDGVMNPEGLRWPDEFVRHKILDCVGDFSLLGLPVLGHFTAIRSGHAFNHSFLQKFLDSKQHWKTHTFT